ncbi:SLC13 family permease [Niveibacterium terrae]|uniref:SLC13 family permease n=1 Tax=Niveibacterium terrae TaxID=3373598 RepID=UPI003A8ED27D
MQELLLVPSRILDRLRQDRLLLILVLLCLGLSLLHPDQVSSYPQRVDWPTIAALAGLLLLTTGLEECGFLQRSAFELVTRMHSERQLALFLVLASALLACVLTNDIALFIVVPLTLGLRGMARLPTSRLVIFEALAVNAGSVLTPLGNPQNLFLWHRSGVAFHTFVAAMLPLALILIAVLLLFTIWAFAPVRIETHEDVEAPSLNRRLLGTSLLLYPAFVVLLDLHRPLWALALVAGVFLVAARRVLRQVDWALIAIFVLMFIDLRLVAELEPVRHLVEAIGLDYPLRLFASGVLVSQLISNVPAAILLAEHSGNWRVVAWAVDVGGFGFLVGSLANLIALRLLGDRSAWWRFHLYSLPFLAVSALLAGLYLFG